MKLYIKNMVSLRCKLSVKDTLEQLGLLYDSIDLGEVKISSVVSDGQLNQLKSNLRVSGFEILEDNKSILIEKIKAIVVEMVHTDGPYPKTNFSDYIANKLHHDYTYLANIFSEMKGSTIERFIIMHKIERIKELLIYDEMTLKEISYKLNYCSVSHLSAQFKKITGITPTDFKKQHHKIRNKLEDL